MIKKSKNIIDINGQKYEERYLAQIIRRKMMSKIYKSKKQYRRKPKHKNYGNEMEIY